MYYDPEDLKETLKEVNPIVQIPAINDNGFCLAERLDNCKSRTAAIMII